ncbi:hypothetical protein ACFE04_028688 [Oxalis oulophora]
MENKIIHEIEDDIFDDELAEEVLLCENIIKEPGTNDHYDEEKEEKKLSLNEPVDGMKCDSPKSIRFSRLCDSFNEVAEMGAKSEENFQMIMSNIRELMEKFQVGEVRNLTSISPEEVSMKANMKQDTATNEFGGIRANEGEDMNTSKRMQSSYANQFMSNVNDSGATPFMMHMNHVGNSFPMPNTNSMGTPFMSLMNPTSTPSMPVMNYMGAPSISLTNHLTSPFMPHMNHMELLQMQALYKHDNSQSQFVNTNVFSLNDG